ncbi:MAG: hypothetical protein KDC34_13715 [Saprospiraceae bacterium]|nr:hypothetical protein [Saprospiraceae bacterium]
MGVIFSRVLSILIVCCLLFSVSIFIREYRKLPQTIRWFGWFVVVSCITEAGSFLLARLEISNLFFLHFYTPLKIIFLGLFFSPVFRKEKRDSSQTLYLFITLSVLFSILNSLFIQDFNSINSYAYTVANLLVIVCGAIAFFRLTNPDGLDTPYWQFIRIVLPALFIYECASLFIFMFGPYLEVIEISKQRHLWVANAFLNMILQFFIIRAFLQTRSNTIETAASSQT